MRQQRRSGESDAATNPLFWFEGLGAGVLEARTQINETRRAGVCCCTRNNNNNTVAAPQHKQ